MATMIKTDGAKILQAIGVPAASLDALTAAGITIYVQPNYIKLVKDADVVGSFSANGMLAPKILKGEMAVDDINDMLALATVAVAKALAVGDPKYGMSPIDTLIAKEPEAEKLIKWSKDPPSWVSAGGVIKQPKPTQPENVTEITQTIIGVSLGKPLPKAGKYIYDVDKLTTGPRKKLIDAQRLYQPVNGSGKSSRYFCVAAADDLKIAARYTDTILSIRIEGDVAKYKTELVAAGLGGNIGTGLYCSVHLKVDGHTLARKSLGAAIMSLSAGFKTPYPDLMMIKGKGA